MKCVSRADKGPRMHFGNLPNCSCIEQWRKAGVSMPAHSTHWMQYIF